MRYHFRINKLTIIFSVFLFCNVCQALAYQCNQELGNENVSSGSYDSAFDQLKGCENVKSVTGLTLGQLAVLYSYFGYGNFTSEAKRAEKIYGLYVRSAMKGNEDSVQSLISIFESGEPLILLSPDRQKAECLSKLVPTTEGYKADDVSHCLE